MLRSESGLRFEWASYAPATFGALFSSNYSWVSDLVLLCIQLRGGLSLLEGLSDLGASGVVRADLEIGVSSLGRSIRSLHIICGGRLIVGNRSH